MPARSIAQRRLMAMALHDPDRVMKKNRGILGMSKEDMHDFASSSEKGLPKRKRKHRGILGKE